MEYIELKTPGGYKVYLKPKLSWGEFQDLQEYVAAQIKIDPSTQQAKNDITGDVLYVGSRKAMEMLVVKILLPDGTEATDIAKTLHEMDIPDGQCIKDKIDELTKDLKIDKKRGTS